MNCFASTSRLFIAGGERYFLVTGTQGDPTEGNLTAMEAYSLGILPLIKVLLEFINLSEINANKVTFADGLSLACTLNSI